MNEQQKTKIIKQLIAFMTDGQTILNLMFAKNHVQAASILTIRLDRTKFMVKEMSEQDEEFSQFFQRCGEELDADFRQQKEMFEKLSRENLGYTG